MLGARSKNADDRSVVNKVGGARRRGARAGAARCEDERRALQAAYDQSKKRREDAQKRNDERLRGPSSTAAGVGWWSSLPRRRGEF